MVRFDLESLNELRHLSLSARRVGGGILAKPRARLPAGGTELAGHRDYAPGDDYRSVDWNLAARHDELLVKQFAGEADCPTYILLDCSRSMSLSRPSKLDVARRIVLALAYVALRRPVRPDRPVGEDREAGPVPPRAYRARGADRSGGGGRGVGRRVPATWAGGRGERSLRPAWVPGRAGGAPAPRLPPTRRPALRPPRARARDVGRHGTGRRRDRRLLAGDDDRAALDAIPAKVRSVPRFGAKLLRRARHRLRASPHRRAGESSPACGNRGSEVSGPLPAWQ